MSSHADTSSVCIIEPGNQIADRRFSMIEHRNRKLSCVTKLIISESCDNEISLIFTSPIVMLPDVTSQNLEINLATVDLPPPARSDQCSKTSCRHRQVNSMQHLILFLTSIGKMCIFQRTPFVFRKYSSSTPK